MAKNQTGGLHFGDGFGSMNNKIGGSARKWSHMRKVGLELCNFRGYTNENVDGRSCTYVQQTPAR